MSKKPLDPALAPGHTDLMVEPESLDAFLEANPLPHDPYSNEMTPKQYAAAIEALLADDRAAEYRRSRDQRGEYIAKINSMGYR